MYRYKGGSTLPDIPARDLSDAEVADLAEKLGRNVGRILVTSGLYEHIDDKLATPRRKVKIGRGGSENKEQ